MNKYFLHISEPCTEDWDKMTPASQGRFCGSCQKTVFDFTNATENDIIKHIEKMKGNMFCGQFEEGQLNRWMEKTSIETSNPSLYKYLLSFLLLTAGQNMVAQDVKAKQENVVKISKGDSALMVQALKAEMPDKSCGIKGIQVRSSSSAAIGKQSRIRLGGVSTLSTTKNSIYLLDGKKIDSAAIANLNPDNIDSLSILQAAQARAIYGSEGASGVIIITTKNKAKQKTNKFSAKNK
jgi:TonB-dependent SusC/RagA subfamily outer membrane receptor